MKNTKKLLRTGQRHSVLIWQSGTSSWNLKVEIPFVESYEIQIDILNRIYLGK